MVLTQTKFSPEAELADLAGRGLRVIGRTLRLDSRLLFPRTRPLHGCLPYSPFLLFALIKDRVD
jgi:hypothetical protein